MFMNSHGNGRRTQIIERCEGAQLEHRRCMAEGVGPLPPASLSGRCFISQCEAPRRRRSPRHTPDPRRSPVCAGQLRGWGSYCG